MHVFLVSAKRDAKRSQVQAEVGRLNGLGIPLGWTYDPIPSEEDVAKATKAAKSAVEKWTGDSLHQLVSQTVVDLNAVGYEFDAPNSGRLKAVLENGKYVDDSTYWKMSV